MKIVGGSFGVGGTAWVSRDNCLVIDSGGKATYKPSGITDVSAELQEISRFGVFGFIVGSVLLSVVLGMFIGVIGVLIGVFLAFVGSRYKDSKTFVNVTLADGKSVKIQCSRYGTKKLIKLKG